MTGSAGTTGSAGSAGSAGTSGSAGSTGSAGTTGSAGSAGSAGAGGRGGTGAGAGGVTGAAGRGGTSGVAGSSGNAGTTGNAGRGGATGSAGQGGSGGKGGTGGGQSCAELQSAYNKAMQQAKVCNLTLTVVQCTHLVSSQLLCCPTYVNDRTEVDQIYAQWQAAACPPNLVCPAIVCPNPTGAACVPISAGDRCMDVTSAAN
jgi:hypothetical protein